MHTSHTHLTHLPLTHCSHTHLSHTSHTHPTDTHAHLSHTSHTPPSHALLSHTPLTHTSHTLLSHTSHSQTFPTHLLHTPFTHLTHTHTQRGAGCLCALQVSIQSRLLASSHRQTLPVTGTPLPVHAWIPHTARCAPCRTLFTPETCHFCPHFRCKSHGYGDVFLLTAQPDTAFCVVRCFWRRFLPGTKRSGWSAPTLAPSC